MAAATAQTSAVAGGPGDDNFSQVYNAIASEKELRRVIEKCAK